MPCAKFHYAATALERLAGRPDIPLAPVPTEQRPFLVPMGHRRRVEFMPAT
jgi:hypothetical protein